MAKTKEELNNLKIEYETLNSKLKELTEEELKLVTGGNGEDGEDKPNVIIDNGTGYIKAGFSGEEGPRAVFPGIVGKPKSSSAMVG